MDETKRLCVVWWVESAAAKCSNGLKEMEQIPAGIHCTWGGDSSTAYVSLQMLKKKKEFIYRAHIFPLNFFYMKVAAVVFDRN